MMLRSLRHVIRELTVRPGVTVVAAAALALGIAVNTVIFSGVSCDFDRWRQSNPAFEEMAASRSLNINLPNPGPDSASTERIVGRACAGRTPSGQTGRFFVTL